MHQDLIGDDDVYVEGGQGNVKYDTVNVGGHLQVGKGTNLIISKSARVGGKVIMEDGHISVGGNFTFSGEKLPKGVAMWLTNPPNGPVAQG